jgi:hypothetical protein
MLLTWEQLVWGGRAILGAEFLVFVYWVTCIGVVGLSDPATFDSSIVSALHYGATFALYMAIIEVERSHHASSHGHGGVEVPTSNMWLALAVVALVTDTAGLMNVARSSAFATLPHLLWVMLVVLNSLLVGMTAVDIAWLLGLRVMLAESKGESFTAAATSMWHKLVPPPLNPDPVFEFHV